jgi:hypothetical protein
MKKNSMILWLLAIALANLMSVSCVPQLHPEDCESGACAKVAIAGSAYEVSLSNDTTPMLIEEVVVLWGISGEGMNAYIVHCEYVDSSSVFSFNITIDTTYFAEYELRIRLSAARYGTGYQFKYFDRNALQNIKWIVQH